MPVCPRCGALNEDKGKACRVCSADMGAAPGSFAIAPPAAAVAPGPVPISIQAPASRTAAGSSGRFWAWAILFIASVTCGALLWKGSFVAFDATGPGVLDENYTVLTQNGTTSYQVTYTFTVNGRQFAGKDTVPGEPVSADTTVYYMSEDPAQNALHSTGTSDRRILETAGAFLVAIVALILLPKNYLMPIGVPSSAAGVGDSQAEQRGMKRGKYSAWAHVFIAFAMQVAGVGFLLALIVSLLVRSPLTGFTALGVGFAVAAFATLWIFSDRFRCIEAFASRSCSGMMNLSLLYVPFVALVYANYRGLRKFSGR